MTSVPAGYLEWLELRLNEHAALIDHRKALTATGIQTLTLTPTLTPEMECEELGSNPRITTATPPS